MRKLIIVLMVSLMLSLATAATVFADPPTPACNGLDVAHGQIHSSGTQAESMLHDLRGASQNHC